MPGAGGNLVAELVEHIPKSFIMRLSILLNACLPTALASTYCKPIPGTAGWPSEAAWAALNRSVSGNLIAPTPPAAVCHPDWPQYNQAACKTVTDQWTNTLWHASNPVSVDYNDNTCPPNASLPCTAAGYPSFVIQATDASHVQAGVNFARKTGIRLVIKNTGHDYPGRSSGPDSLLINTHHIQGISYFERDPAAVKLGGVGSVKLAAGVQMRQLYAFAADHNLTLVGGADPDVGVGGWVSGAGHSPVSARYGLGADQVIGMEVVTADGRLRNINATCEPDLFWALRGGGAGTYAVLISVTMKAHPAISVSSVLFTANTTADSDTFWSMVTYFHTQLPRLAESGLMGYLYHIPLAPLGSGGSNIGIVYASLLGPELSVAETKAIMAPLEKNLSGTAWGDEIVSGSTIAKQPQFASFWHNYNQPESAGTSSRLGSRLLGNDTLLGDFDTLRDSLRATTPAGQILLGTLIARPGTAAPPGGIAGGSNAVLPAWRDAYNHVIIPRAWPQGDVAAMELATTKLRNTATEALRRVAPRSGAYMNEADPTEPDWQQTFFGTNYPRLLTIKQSWDPAGVFWCKNCVGSELWSREGPYGIENGVGQNFVRLCRAEGPHT